MAAAFQLLNNNNTWLLKGDQYIQFLLTNPDVPLYGPHAISPKWNSFQDSGWTTANAFLRDVSAPEAGVVKAFVFNGADVMYIRVQDTQWWTDTRLLAPSPIDTTWKALEIAGFTANPLSAAFLSSNEGATSQAWFFSNRQCCLVEFKFTNPAIPANDELETFVVRGPALITTVFNSLGRAGFDTVDCILDTAIPNVRWFFRQEEAVLINTHEDTIVQNRENVNTIFPALNIAGFYA